MRATSAKQWARLYGRWQFERLMVRFGLRKTAPFASAQIIDRDPALDFNVSADYYAKLKAGPASLRATLYVTLYGNRQSVSIGGQRVTVPGIGACSVQPRSPNDIWRHFGGLPTSRLFVPMLGPLPSCLACTNTFPY
jgi:hypothetical protein